MSTAKRQPQRIAIFGRARSGKDTAGQYLMQKHGYNRLSIIEGLRIAAMTVNPYINEQQLRYADAVKQYGYEETKNVYPEARAFLQRLGDAMRGAAGDNVFLSSLEPLLADNNAPIVVTDGRLIKEAQFLREHGFTLIKILRDNHKITNLDTQHLTETMVDEIVCDHIIYNNCTLQHFYDEIDALLK